jgi:SAM-dependent methyltransferase
MPGRQARAARWSLWGLAAAHVALAAHLRHRRAAVVPLASSGPDGPAAPATRDAPHADTDLADRLTVLPARGVEVDAATRRAVAHEMAATGAQVVDLVPGDLPAERALAALNRVDPLRLGTDPLYAPGGADEAVVLHPSVAARLEARATEVPAGGLRRDELLRRTAEAQRCAPSAAVQRLAPDLHAGPDDPDERWAELEQVTAFLRPYIDLAPVAVAAELVHLLVLTAGLVVAPLPAAAALAAWSAQPAVVLGRGQLDASLRRLPRAWAMALGTVRAAVLARRAAALERADTPAPVAPPADELFEPRRDRCPWCGSDVLTGRLDTPDLLQHKPGTFHLDQCRDCGLVFQNPALSLAGLNFYYDEFYDGAREELAERAFAGLDACYQGRVAAVAQWTEPRSWLDVGSGHGHFCLVARQRWPEARFDGLDLSESIEQARRRGWVDTAYRGLFPDLADGLPRSYDVVSMHHYLEHTRDPRRELAAAAKVLEPGGHLLVEMPDPECTLGRWLGRYWPGWFQPQHQQMPPCDELVAALDGAGFDVVSVERGTATTGTHLSVALLMASGDWAPGLQSRWRAPGSPAGRARRLAMMAVALPGFAILSLADALKDAYDRRPGNRAPGNAYRVVARRR